MNIHKSWSTSDWYLALFRLPRTRISRWLVRPDPTTPLWATLLSFLLRAWLHALPQVVTRPPPEDENPTPRFNTENTLSRSKSSARFLSQLDINAFSGNKLFVVEAITVVACEPSPKPWQFSFASKIAASLPSRNYWGPNGTLQVTRYIVATFEETSWEPNSIIDAAQTARVLLLWIYMSQWRADASLPPQF